MDEKVEKVIREVTEKADVGREKLLEEIEKKQEELSGFITPEGAAIIIARNYGVTPEREEPEVHKLRIGDLSEGMSNVDIVGKISRIFEPREFERKDGSKGKVASLTLMDESGEVRLVLWGKRAELVLKEEIQKGKPLRVEGAYTKKGRTGSLELHIGGRGRVELDPTGERVEDLPPVADPKVKISELDAGSEFADVVGRVTAVTNSREFERSDGSKGKVATMRIADETGQARVSLWGDKAEKTDEIDQGDAVKIENASIREGQQGNPELHVNWQSRIVGNIPLEEKKNLPEFERKLLKVEEIEPDMPVIDLAAKVRRTFPPKEFNRSDGSKGRVMNALLADETGTIRISFWGDMVETGQKLSPGDTLLLENARSSAGLNDRPEIRIGQRTNLKVNPEDVHIEEMKPSKIKMSELEEGLDSLEVLGRIVDKSELREFTRSDGEKGKVASLTIGDETGTGRVTLWGPKTDLLNELDIGDIVNITDSYSVASDYGGAEIHVGEQASVDINPEVEVELPAAEELGGTSEKSRVKIGEVSDGSQVEIRGTIVRIFERSPLFSVCPNCGRSLGGENTESMCEKCEETVEPEHRIVLNMIVDDGTGNMRVVVFGELGERLIGKDPEEIQAELAGDAELVDFYEGIDLEGREIVFTGSVRRDDYYDQLELRAQDFYFPEAGEEAERLLGEIKGEEEIVTEVDK